MYKKPNPKQKPLFKSKKAVIISKQFFDNHIDYFDKINGICLFLPAKFKLQLLPNRHPISEHP